MSKILIIQVHSGIGGATTSLFQLCSGLKLRGAEVEVLITGGDGPLRTWLEENGVKVHLLSGLLSYGHGNGARTPFWSIPPFRPITDLRKLPSTIKTYRRFIRENHFDIVYLNTSILWPAAIAAKKEGKKVITHVREVWYHGFLGLRKRLFIAITERFSDRIFSLSHFSKSQFRNKDKVHVLYNAVDFSSYDLVTESQASLRDKLGLQQNLIYVVMMGGALPHKGGFLFLQAAHTLKKKHKDLAFVILGNINAYYPEKAKTIRGIIRSLLVPDPGKKFQQAIRKFNFGKALITPGSVRNVPEWVKATDILVFPATEDHFGRPIIEAGYLKIPAIASDGDTSKELIPNETNGLLFRNGSKKEFIEKIERLAMNKSLRENMGEAGRKLAEERYSLDKQVDKVMAVLNELQLD